MFALAQPNWFETFIAGVLEETRRLPLHCRVDYLEVVLNREIRSATALKKKCSQRLTEKRYRIIWLLETLCVGNAWSAGTEIVIGAEHFTAETLEQFLANCTYATAHEALDAVVHSEKLLLGVQEYLQAKHDAANAHDLGRRLEDLKCSFDKAATDIGDALYLAIAKSDGDPAKWLVEYLRSGIENGVGRAAESDTAVRR